MGCGETDSTVNEEKREQLRQHYGETARTSCSCGTTQSNIYAPEQIATLPPEAIKASRGCADPHAAAALKPGERVLDLGSGGGIDALLAAREVGASGSVVGVDTDQGSYVILFDGMETSRSISFRAKLKPEGK